MAHAGIDTDDDEPSANELDDGLGDVREAVTDLLKKIDRDSDQIEKAVARAFIGGANSEAAEELRKHLAKQIGECHENQSITLDEILVALWVELSRASEMATQNPDDEPDEEETDNDQSGESDTAESQEGNEGLRRLFGEKDTDEDLTDEESEKTADPAFQ